MSKYHNRKVQADGIVFDSQAEYRRYQELCLLERSGQILNLSVHPRIILLPKCGGLRQVTYTGDFAYLEKGAMVIEDVKGGPTKTAVWRLKWNLAQRAYREYEFRVIET